jgi:hypothetical protein
MLLILLMFQHHYNFGFRKINFQNPQQRFTKISKGRFLCVAFNTFDKKRPKRPFLMHPDIFVSKNLEVNKRTKEAGST